MHLAKSIHLLVSLFFLCFAQYSLAAPGDTINVTSSAQLNAALSSANGGETIRLADGDYGQLELENRNFSDYVTITSANGNLGGKFGNIEFNNSSYVRLDNLKIVVNGREGVGIFEGSHHIDVLNSEIHGSTLFDRSNPSYEQVQTLYAINTGGNVHNILIENINAHDIKSSAYLFNSITDSVVRENTCDWVAADCYKLANVDGMLFENNSGSRNVHASPTAHVDFVQGQGPVSNSIFRGNVAIMATHGFQGLFFDDATFTNITFENNLIYTSSIRGISVSSPSSGPASSGIIARYNTVLIPRGRFKASLILIPSGSVQEHNIVSNSTTKNPDRFPGTNIIAQWDDANDIAHYSQYYVNAMRGVGAEIADFRPVSGSRAENQTGAFARIFELLDGTSDPNDPTIPGPGTPQNSQRALPAIMLLLDELQTK